MRLRDARTATPRRLRRFRLATDGAKVVIGADVKNVGGRDGEEVVQLYVRAPAAAGDRRQRHLEGFRRVPLKVGEKKRVMFELDDSAISVFGDDGKPFVPDGATTFFIGGGQPGVAPGVDCTLN